jgi:hypothetical protein
MTGTSLVTDSLEELAAITPGDALTAPDAAKGLAVLNRMIDSMNIGRGNIFTSRIDTWVLTSNQQTYTVGPTGVFVMPRPLGLSHMNLFIPGGSTPVRRPIRLLNDTQWAAKTVQNIVGLPVECYSDGSNPLTTWYFYMIPDQAYTIETYTWQQFTQLNALTDAILIPQGYQEFWTLALAIRLAAAYGRTPSAMTLALYSDAKAAVWAMNSKSPRLRSDGELPGDAGGLYNWISGELEDF